VTTGSVVVRRSLGRRLRALRAEERKTAADVTAAGIASKAKLARIEAGIGAVKMADVRALCWLYGADQATTDALAELALNTASEGWWEDYGDVMPAWFALYVELEAAASEVLVYDPELVYGILQTPAYQRAIFTTAPGLTPESAERQVRLRSERQRAAFDRDPPLRIVSVLGEGVLARNVGGAAVMAEQRDHLRRLAERPHVEILVLPWAAGAHVAMKGGFVVLNFSNQDDPDLVYLETYAGGRYIEQGKMIQEYRDMFAAVRKQSLTIEEYLG
jgi:transcriptional regulator with XRE-family HTH domain